jgi:hypothetical protein
VHRCVGPKKSLQAQAVDHFFQDGPFNHFWREKTLRVLPIPRL